MCGEEKLKDEPFSLEEGHRLVEYIGILSSKFPDVQIIDLLEKYNLIYSKAIPIEGSEKRWLTWELEYTLKDYNTLPRRSLWVSNEYSPTNANHLKYLKLRERGYALKEKGKLEEGRALITQAVEIRKNNRITAPDYGRQIFIPPDVAYHYVSLLATKFATDLNCDIIADGETYCKTVLGDVRKLRGEVMTSVLQAYLPKDFYTMDISQIGEFREEFQTKRLRYEKEVQSLVKEFSDIASEGQLDKIKKTITDIAIERVEETRKIYQRAKVEIVAKTFGLSITPSALVASISSALGIGLFAPVGITAALASIGIIKWLEYKKAKTDKLKSPWSYVLDSAQLKK